MPETITQAITSELSRNIQLSIWILLLPLFSFLIQIIFGKKMQAVNPAFATILPFAAIFSGLAMSTVIFTDLVVNRYDPNHLEVWDFSWVFFAIPQMKISMGIMIDNMTAIMLMVVTLISSLVHLFSFEYMKGDPRFSRFYAFLSVFSFSMLGLVLSHSLFGLYIFWELVGLSSFLLIGFWFEKDTAADACKKAFLTNRIGDIGMFLGILIVFITVGTLVLPSIGESEGVYALVEKGELAGTMLTLAGIGLFCGAIGKSAQFPLHVWLPDAMEGPTPVSALIHAATMVAAGVYLVARIFPILTPDSMLVIAYIGGFTAFFAATIAITQNDIKKVLAYSTISQLGYMIMGLGVGAYSAAFFHLVTHAMFKACLFLGSGSVIHAMHHALHHLHDHHTDPQDMRNMGGLKNKLPITYGTFLIATCAIAGVPFFSGFLSKDAILAGSLAFSMSHTSHFILPVFGFGAALMTAFYMFRIIWMTFHGEPQKKEIYDEIHHENPIQITLPLMILAGLSFWIWWAPKDILSFIVGANAENSWFLHLIALPKIAVAETHELLEHLEHYTHAAHIPATVISLIVAGTGILASYLMYQKKSLSADDWAKRMGILYTLSFNKYYVDEFYVNVLVKGFLLNLNNLLAWTDRVIVDGIVNLTASLTVFVSKISGLFDKYVVDLLVNASGFSMRAAGMVLTFFQTGKAQNYFAFTVLGILALLTMIVM
ncbi:NADH-quinone oxidoreductase subunit L [bacterium]|nr:NADH-quinone oxidoreductase subunit L [bacterium]